jgi:hypothetical protein
MVVKVPLRLVPTAFIAAIAATAISAAISPYSIAVTPDSFLIRFVKSSRNLFSSTSMVMLRLSYKNYHNSRENF